MFHGISKAILNVMFLKYQVIGQQKLNAVKMLLLFMLVLWLASERYITELKSIVNVKYSLYLI